MKDNIEASLKNTKVKENLASDFSESLWKDLSDKYKFNNLNKMKKKSFSGFYTWFAFCSLFLLLVLGGYIGYTKFSSIESAIGINGSNTTQTKDLTPNDVKTPGVGMDNNDVTAAYTVYTNKKGHFSLKIPTGVKLYTEEFEDKNVNGQTIGGTYFSFDKNKLESGMVVEYYEPYMEGGGGCFDDYGHTFTEETIAGQKATVCDLVTQYMEFTVTNMKNPTRLIFYTVDINTFWGSDVKGANLKTLKSIVRTSLSFN